MSAENTKTRAWELYELGRNYNESLTPTLYNLVDTNTEFFSGNQWLRLPDTPAMRGLPKPVFNVLKRVASLFIASLTSSATSLHFEPLAYYDGSNLADPQHDAAEVANAEAASLLEKFKFDYRIRDALFDGAVTGDYCAHFWFDPHRIPYGGAFDSYRGEIRMELVDGVNVMFGNPNSRDAQEQPYILLVGRDTVENLRKEAVQHQEDFAVESIQPDSETDRMPGSGGKLEIIESEAGSGKALFVYLYTKVEGRDGTSTVHVTKATRSAVIFEDIDTGLSLYPVAWGNI